jgi:hypothetical protein
MANVLLNYGAGAASSVPSGAARQTASFTDPVLRQAYQDFLKSSKAVRGKVKPSNRNVLLEVDYLSDLSKPVQKEPGLFTKILSNPVTRVALTPLAAIDVPRRMVISGAKELYDLAEGGDASFAEFAKQVKDPSFGVGKFVNTGNKWLDRAIGFTGDVVADPSTYVTLGAGKFAGAAGRLALATDLASKGAAEALVQKAGIRGLTGLTAAERAAYNLPKAGLYLGGAKGIRIPGTQGVGEVIGRGLSKTRAGLGATEVGGKLRRARSDERFLDLTEKLLAGQGRISATNAAKTYGAIVNRKGYEGLVLKQLGQDFDNLASTIREAPNAAEVTKALEKGAFDESPAARSASFLLQSWHKRMVDEGVQVGYIPNYAPRVWTDEGRALFSADDKFGEDVRKLFGVTVNELRAPSAVRSRTFRITPGEVYEVGGKKLTFGEDTIDEINRVFNREFGIKVLEDDINTLLNGYARQVSKAIGNQKFADRLVQSGVAGKIDELSGEVVDEAATKARDKAWREANAEFVDDLKRQKKVAQAKYDELYKPYAASLGAFKGKVEEILKARGVVLQGDLKNVIADMSKFVSENQTKQFDLGTQAKLIDDAIYRTERAINVAEAAEREAVAKASREVGAEAAARRFDPVINRAAAERDVANAVLGELKSARNQLDSLQRQLDETLVKLPTISAMPEEAQAVLRRRNAIVEVDESGNVVVGKAAEQPLTPTVEPYRVVDGSEQEYRARNAFEQFRGSYRDGSETAAKYSPEAAKLVDDARRTFDGATQLDRETKLLVADINNIGNVQVAYDATKRRYDYIHGALVNRLDSQIEAAGASAVARLRGIRLGLRAGAKLPAKSGITQKYADEIIAGLTTGDPRRTAEVLGSMSAAMKQRAFGKDGVAKVERLLQTRINAEYGGLWNLGANELKNYISKNGFNVIRRFELELMPAFDNIDNIYARRNALLEKIGVATIDGAETAVAQQFDKASGLLRQAKARALSEYASFIDSPALGANIKNVMLTEYQTFFDRLIETVDTMRRINTKQTFTDDTTRAWVREAVTAKDALDDITTKIRVHTDFATRYKNVTTVMDAKGLPYDRDGLAALVAKEVLATEVANLRSAKGSLIEAQSKVIQDGVDALRRESRRGASSTLDAVKEGVAIDLTAKARLVEGLVNDWLAVRRELGEVTRTSTLQLSKTQKEELAKLEKAVSKAKTPKEQAMASKALADFREKNKRVIDVRGVSAAEAANLGIDYEMVAASGLNVPGPGSSRAVRKEMKDLEELIVQAVFGEQSVRPENFSFTKFIDEVTGAVAGEGNVRKLDNVKLDNWIKSNGLPEISKGDVGRVMSFFEMNPKTGSYSKRGPKGAAESRTATVAASIQDQIDVLDARITSLTKSNVLLGSAERFPKPDEDLIAKYPSAFVEDIGDDPIAMSEKLASLEARRDELKPRALPSLTRANQPQRVGLIEQTEQQIASLTARLKAAGLSTTYKPTVADRKRMFQLNKTADYLRKGIASGKIKDTRLLDVQRELDAVVQELADIEARSWKYSGTSKARDLFRQLQDTRALRESLVDELARIGDNKSGEIGYWRSRMRYGKTDIKPKSGYAVSNWSGVLFSDSLGTARRPNRMFLRDRQELLAREIELQQILALPNQSVLEGRMVKLSEAIEKNGGVNVINRRFDELTARAKQIDDALAKADPEDVKIVALGMTPAGLKAERKAVAAELKKLGALRSSITKRIDLEMQIGLGRMPGAQARVDELNRVLVPMESRTRNAEAVLAASRVPSDEDARFGRQALDFYQSERARINDEISATRRIGEDGSQALADSKIAVETQIKDLADDLQAAKTSPSFGRVPVKDVENRVDEINVWMDKAYALVDPEGYASRVQRTAPVDRYGPPTVADELAALGMEPATPETTATLALYADATKAEAELLKAAGDVSRLDQMVNGTKNLPSFGAVMKKQIQDGMVELQGTGVVIPQEINDALERIMHLDNPERWGQFWKAWDGYADIFKAYATLSPRFHIRNALSATMMNYADGVATRDMLDGVKYWKQFKNNPNKWMDVIPADQRKDLADAILAVYGSGGGRYSEFQLGGRGTRNFFVTASRDIGTSVEGAVRLGMALNTIRGGGSVDEAVARITRIHFDYSQVSTADSYVRRVIPFWTFMSRNIPLQMQQIWLKPRTYQIYASAVRNLRGEPTGEVVPSYYEEQGIFKSPVGSGYIKPDLAWTGLPSQINQATTAAGLLSQANPALRIPLEAVAGKKFFTGAPLREGETASYAAEALIPYLNTIKSLTGVGKGGQSYMSPQAQAAADESAGQAQLNAILSFIGAPYTSGPTLSQQRGEILRRKALMEELAKRIGG